MVHKGVEEEEVNGRDIKKEEEEKRKRWRKQEREKVEYNNMSVSDVTNYCADSASPANPNKYRHYYHYHYQVFFI